MLRKTQYVFVLRLACLDPNSFERYNTFTVLESLGPNECGLKSDPDPQYTSFTTVYLEETKKQA